MYKCPVCDKAGIPDYLNENVVCPNCNSNLGVYRTLHKIAEGNDNSNVKVHQYKMLSIVLPILAVLLIGIFAFFYTNSKLNEYDQRLTDANNVVMELRDSINTLSSQIEKTKTAGLSSSSNYIEYAVLSNDSPWRIVRKFYGIRRDWESISQKIAEQNDLWNGNTGTWKQIHPGQIIKIHNTK